MKTIQLTALLSISIICQCICQSTISGTITDENGPLGYVNVVLHSLPDSNTVTVIATDANGTYQMEAIQNGSYYLEALMLSYVDLISESFQLENESIILDMNMVEETNLLNTVEITARVPLLEQKADRLVVNVAKSLTSVNGSLLDVMKKVPGMIVVNGKLNMAGNSSVTILINGRSTQYLDMESLLREMPSDNIEKIEVITQPGAEFEAAGTGPIINIVLKSNKMYGINGNVFAGVGKGETSKRSVGMNLSYRQGFLNVYGNAGISNNKSNERFLLDRTIGETVYNQQNSIPFDPTTLRINVGADYYISKKQEVGLSLKRSSSEGDRIQTNLSKIISPFEDENRTFNTTNAVDRGWEFLSGDAYYTIKLDTNGQKLELDLNISQFDTEKSNLITSEEQDGRSNNFLDTKYDQPGLTKFWVGQLDYTLPLSKSIEFKTGAKYTDASIDNNFRSEFLKEGEWNFNEDESNHYLFDETIGALYTKLNYSSKDWNVTAGLRYEDSRSIGYSITIDSTLNRDVEKLFPSASISKKISGPISAALAYSYRINRPNYTTLNPFVLALDPLTSERGNTNLLPELTHSSKFTLTYDGQPFFNLEYRDTKDAIVYVTEQNDDTGEASATNVNLDNLKQYNGSLFLPLEMFIPGITGYTGVIANYNKYDSEYLNETFDRSKLSITSFIQVKFQLPLGLSAEASGWYVSGGQDGIIDFGHMYGSEFGVQKKLLDDKLSVNLSWSDPIYRYWNGNLNFANMQATMQSQWEINVVEMRVSYTFGNQHLKKKEKRQGRASSIIQRASEDK
ncbi:MAG: outer membrane beta-barrel protein [Saprospiraceae bacterium]|nr:outer membrane beta-barrel protein [Saprospiraceae bacterium]